MLRTQIYLSKQQRSGLHILAEQTGKSQSELIREAIEYYLTHMPAQDKESIFAAARGMWKNRKDLPDFQEIRHSLDRQHAGKNDSDT